MSRLVSFIFSSGNTVNEKRLKPM